MKRDGKGRFIKTDDSNKIIIHFPTIKRILIWIVIIWVLMPWITIISKLNILKKILDLFECLFTKSNAENEDTTKKMGYFLNKCYFFI